MYMTSGELRSIVLRRRANMFCKHSHPTSEAIAHSQNLRCKHAAVGNGASHALHQLHGPSVRPVQQHHEREAEGSQRRWGNPGFLCKSWHKIAAHEAGGQEKEVVQRHCSGCIPERKERGNLVLSKPYLFGGVSAVSQTGNENRVDQFFESCTPVFV